MHLTTEEPCDCPHAVYRGVVCKHLAGALEALDQLDALERAEWELSTAWAALVAARAPF